MAIVTRTVIPAEVNQIYNRNLIERLLPLLTHIRWGQTDYIAQKSGSDTMMFRGYNALPAITTPLAEGVTPDPQAITTRMVTARVRPYGARIEYSDEVDYLTPDNLLLTFTDILGEQAGLSFDTLCRDVITAGTTVQRVNDRATRGGATGLVATDVISAAEIRRAVTQMQMNNARPLTRMVNPDAGFNTNPVRPAFWAITSPQVISRLRGLPEWRSVETYAREGDIIYGEEGTIEGVRVVGTSNAKIFVGEGGGSPAINVHSFLILGANAYGIVRLTGKNLETIVTPAIDPLRQRNNIAWKGTFAAVILNELAMLRLECAA